MRKEVKNFFSLGVNVKTIVKVDGMMCSMCEAHINDVIRKKL